MTALGFEHRNTRATRAQVGGGASRPPRRATCGYPWIRVFVVLGVALVLFPAVKARAQSTARRNVLSSMAAQDWIDDDDTLSFEGSHRAIRSAQCQGLGLRYPFAMRGQSVVPGYEDFRCDVVLLKTGEGDGFYRRLSIWAHVVQNRPGIPHFRFTFQSPKPDVADKATPYRAGYSYCREFPPTRIRELYSFPSSWENQRIANAVGKTLFQPVVLREAFARGCQKGLARGN